MAQNPTDRTEAEMMDRWLDGDIGYTLVELAKLALPDVTDHKQGSEIAPGVFKCERCGWVFDTKDDIVAPDLCQWPPYDIEQEIKDKLEQIKREVERL